jgi:glycosyltransferase involved in cell wall biosynthesis
MRVLLSSTHRYPARGDAGSGLHPKQFPSGSGFFIHDLLAQGLAELGHEVLYLLPQETDKPLPEGIVRVSEPSPDVDVLHTIAYRDQDVIRYMEGRGKPWVTTCHLDLKARGREQSPTTENWIFVSRTLARSHGRDRHVLNGVNPSDYFFSESKEDYLLFMSSLDWCMEKGLDFALDLSARVGFKLIVAGTGRSYEVINEVRETCVRAGAVCVGDVGGARKAELLAGAKAFLFPTRVNEAFGLGMVEALMSGTPVICSDAGACPEIISSEVGFVCANEEEFVSAINRLGEISPQACRDKALRDYHYLRMVADYVSEYQKEIARLDE